MMCAFCNFRYENQILVEYNVQCEEDQMAGYVITDLDIQRKRCHLGGGQFV